jgi:predicted nicotinamide N-methyase
VRDHFATTIAAYRIAAGAGKWTPVEIDARELGEHSLFVTVHWNALDGDGNVVRDTWTSNQLLATPDGWRMLSYTNHF